MAAHELISLTYALKKRKTKLCSVVATGSLVPAKKKNVCESCTEKIIVLGFSFEACVFADVCNDIGNSVKEP